MRLEQLEEQGDLEMSEMDCGQVSNLIESPRFHQIKSIQLQSESFENSYSKKKHSEYSVESNRFDPRNIFEGKESGNGSSGRI